MCCRRVLPSTMPGQMTTTEGLIQFPQALLKNDSRIDEKNVCVRSRENGVELPGNYE